MAIRAITFDFWCTLFRDANGSERQRIRTEAFVAATGASEEATVEALSDATREFFRHHIEEQRTLEPIDAVRMAAKTVGATLSEQEQERLAAIFGTAILAHSPVPIEGALEAVRAAADWGPIGIVSDSGMSPGSSLRKLLERHGFIDHFGALAFSDEVGVAKPQAKMFETAAEGLGVRVDELLHIGDLELTDIDGARAVGAKAALFTGENDRHLNETKADYTFETWQEFVEVLPSIG
jgi:putative hydrolase of the HAD superfamily